MKNTLIIGILLTSFTTFSADKFENPLKPSQRVLRSTGDLAQCDPKEIISFQDVVEKVLLLPEGYSDRQINYLKDIEYVEQSSPVMLNLKKIGLSTDETMALHYYTLRYYIELNSALRKKSKSLECYQPWTIALDSALKKLPIYSGTVYRVQRDYPGMEEQHMPGNIVTYDAYTSTTKKIDGYVGMANFSIRSKSCVDISVLNPSESEVLCPRGIKFRVIKRSVRNTSNDFNYELEEI